MNETLNTGKAVYIEFGNQVGSTPKNLDINIQGIKIKRVNNTKYLDIIFDSYMRWNVHCELYIYIYIHYTHALWHIGVYSTDRQ